MKNFMDEDFLLTNETAVKLYHQYAKDMPIYDFHCHLNPKEIYEDKRFKNITEVWLYGDHYKWRLMRANGIDEKYITGDADDYEKFIAYAKTIPLAIGNPIYHWTHLELKRYFGISDVLNDKTANSIWERANEVINREDFSARNILKKSKVKVVITTDDPIDSLEYHIKLKEEKEFDIKVLPAFRPDKGLNIEKEDFLPWIEKLESASGVKINTYDDFLEALEKRIEFFHSVGCRISDHALDYVFYQKTSGQEVEKIFKKALTGQHLTKEEVDSFKTYTMIFLGKKYAELDWVMQLHIGAMRNNNTKMYKILGPDTGYDSISDFPIAYALSRLLDSLEVENALPKTILYTLNPAANYVIATMIGNFQDGKIPGKMQFGAAWWFNDNKDGIKDQLKSLANVGLLGRFVGMVTDSRSFLSYARHEYFRRVLCDLIGEWVENGEVPNDIELLGKIVQDISFNNAEKYVG
jgi:glucuronate isomerase